MFSDQIGQSMASTNTNLSHLQIPLKDLEKATKNFADANKIAEGVYKGRLGQSGKFVKIAVCRYWTRDDIEFHNEVLLLSNLEHPNLVSLIGFCDEKDKKFIVITHEAYGSLNLYLDSAILTWTQRLRISVDVARALAYLHHDEGRSYAVIHRNINSYTILLDRNWKAKLSSFILSFKQPLNRIEEVIHCDPIGISGYVDPTIEKSGGVTLNSDIYSLGVVLFELLCGRNAYIEEAKVPLASLAKHHYENETLKDIINPQIWTQILSPASYLQYTEIAYSCLKEDLTERPNITYILTQLEQALELQELRQNLINNLEHLKICFSDILAATDNFSETYKIGSIKIFTSYRAELDHFDINDPSYVQEENKGAHVKRRNTVIIKRIKYMQSEMQSEEYFYKNITMLTTIKHPNIVALLGFCVDGLEMILVTENFCNSNLNEYLGNVNRMRILTWEIRLQICIDVARSLNYLHSMMEDKKIIINRCVNKHTIWLDENWGAKIVEFGFSEFLPPNEKDEGVHFEIRDVFSFLIPIYDGTGTLQRKFDVYCFGVLLFEILRGRHVDDQFYNTMTGKDVATQLLCWNLLHKMADPIIMKNTNESNHVLTRGANMDSLSTFIKVVYMCYLDVDTQRPTMTVITKQLEDALNFQTRNQPESIFQHILSKIIRTVDACLISCFSYGSIIEEEQVECSNTYRVVDQPRNALEVQLTNEEGVQCPNTDLVEDKPKDVQLTLESLVKNFEHLKIPLTDIKIATDNFSRKHKIANRGSSTCFRAKLKHYNFSPVVIKRVSSQEHFLTKIKVLTCVKHPNIAHLFGFCVEDSEKIIVIEDVSKGYLANHLTNKYKRRFLTWEIRLKICIDVAHALNYLHSVMEDKMVIMHHEICSYNIGLDENWRAKILCFYKDSVLLFPYQEYEALNLDYSMKRPFYMDLEYKEKFKLKRELDIHSFGIVLFEILYGMLASDPVFELEYKKGVSHLAKGSFIDKKLELIMDPLLNEGAFGTKLNLSERPSKDSLHIFYKIASWCVSAPHDQRLTMTFIIMQLEKAFENKDNSPIISLADIKRATQCFHEGNLIGKGGFGSVYIGNIQDGNGVNTPIAAKQLIRSKEKKESKEGERQFVNELRILSGYVHENVIGLIGYCNEENEQILVFEYASKGSLDRYLGEPNLTWVMRLNICIEVACALYFLHGGFERRAKVIHRDIKTANILINHDWKAKLADFGLSLISSISHERDYVIDHRCGTKGYLDPLYESSRVLTLESDIYSFGIVLFEILCGRSTFEIHKHEGYYLPEFIKRSFEEKKHDFVVFEKIRNQIEPKSLQTFQDIAYQCLADERDNRPTIKEVLEKLMKASVLQALTAFTHLQIPLKQVDGD
ncbi:hypothetical protein QVD17_17028 [Tagetes erecta]|uniref:Protein kinase domain-containing protein n=1 Tax=Tagetes erecta TaxID=13708 RepID=A0AAD8KT38_TARER|nr:hypothetical protein QVD17_17028 [Tagetes erecta]